MTRATTKWREPKAVLAGAIALAAVAVACESPTPTADDPDVDREVAPPPPSEAPTSISEDVASAESADDLPPPPQGGQSSSRPAFLPYDVPPKLQNPGEVQDALVRFYPRDLKNQGIGGRVVLWVFVDEQGEVTRALVQEESGYVSLDEAARRVAAQMEFSPAQNRDETTAVWVQQPITFEVEE